MTSYVPILTLVIVLAYYACASPLVCSIYCAHRKEFPGLKFSQDCSCEETEAGDRVWLRDVMTGATNRRNGLAALGVVSTASPTTTTDICDYLCSIQLGGDACQCSSPGLPGKKRK